MSTCTILCACMRGKKKKIIMIMRHYFFLSLSVFLDLSLLAAFFFSLSLYVMTILSQAVSVSLLS